MSAIRISLANKTLVFLHIQKCAGNALVDLLQAHFKPADVLKAHLLHPTAPEIRRPIRDYRLIIGHNTYDDIQSLAIDPVYVTMLRAPIDRVTSLYYFWRSHRADYIEKLDLRGPRLARRLSLAEFVESEEPEAQFNVNNGQARQFLQGLRGPITLSDAQFLATASRRLQECAFVGSTEQFDRSADLLCYILGWTPPSDMRRVNDSRRNEQEDPRYERIERQPLPDSIRSRIAERNRIDIALYRLGCELLQRKHELMLAELASGAGTPGTEKPLLRDRIRRLARRFRLSDRGGSVS
jgi:hypothetical protein